MTNRVQLCNERSQRSKWFETKRERLDLVVASCAQLHTSDSESSCAYLLIRPYPLNLQSLWIAPFTHLTMLLLSDCHLEAEEVLYALRYVRLQSTISIQIFTNKVFLLSIGRIMNAVKYRYFIAPYWDAKNTIYHNENKCRERQHRTNEVRNLDCILRVLRCRFLFSDIDCRLIRPQLLLRGTGTRSVQRQEQLQKALHVT